MAWVYSVIVTATELSSCSNVGEIRDFEKASALVVVALCAGLMAIVVGVPRSIINGWRQVPAIRASIPAAVPATVPALQKTGTPFPILPAIPPAPGSVPGNDIDDALARSPFPSRINSPLPWLSEIVG